MAITFQKATRKKLRLRLALCGPTGSGKSFTALRIGMALPGPLFAIDTERKSLSKYVGVSYKGDPPFEFDVLELVESQSPRSYVEAIQGAQAAGCGTLIIDSLSHAWIGTDGALEQVDRAAKRSQSGSSFAAWRDITPQHNELVNALLNCDMHLIVTMRSKMEYVLEDDGKGRKVPRKVGMAPIQRDGVEYELDVVGDMNLENELVIGKTRCHSIAGKIFKHPGADVAKVLLAWVSEGAVEVSPPSDDFPPETPAPEATNTEGLALVAIVANATTKKDCRDAWHRVGEAAKAGTISKTLSRALGAKIKEKAKVLPDEVPVKPADGMSQEGHAKAPEPAPSADDAWEAGRL
jgi:hypothetical protein